MRKPILNFKIKQIKCLALVVGIIIFSNTCFAQADSLPVFRQFPIVPPFKLRLLPDSSVFVKDDLKAKRAVIVMVFSPDCDHCRHAVEALLNDINLFKKTQIILSSSLGWDYIRKFYDEFKLAGYTNIKVGYDPDYFLGTFFALKSYPGVFVYDKKGRLKRAFEGSIDWKQAAAEL